ncbi:hypothetical protein Tco_0036256 [Tanacetum coccineum]
MADKKNEASSGSEISESVVSDFGRRRTSCRHCKSGSDTWAHDKEGTRADVSAPGWSANDWLAPEETKILSADQSEADTSAHVSLIMCPKGTY